jgi:hypothetical protein
MFSAASSLPLEGPMIRSGRLLDLIASAVRYPGRLVALVVLVSRTRSESLALTGSAAGRALRAYFNERSLGIFPRNRLCRGVLLLPPDHSEYLRGRRRQALRTNLKRAAVAGITCETAADRSAFLNELEQIYRPTAHNDLEDWRKELARPEVTLMVARDPGGRLLAAVGVVGDSTLSLIIFATAISHEARWALHDHLVRALISRRVRYLLAEGSGPFGALGFSPNVQHYQHLLGYELRHLTPTPTRSVLRLRLVAISVLAMAVAAGTLYALPSTAISVLGF